MNQPHRIAMLVSSSLATLGAAITLCYALADTYVPVRMLRFASASGWLAGSLLALALCVSPLQTLLVRWRRSRPRWLAPVRRDLGIAAASCGLLHGGFAFFALPGVSALLLSSPWLRAGLLTLCILLALFLTSFDPILRRLRLQHWKELHRLVYPATILLAMHIFLGPFGSPAIEVSFISFLAVLLVLRVSKLRTAHARSSD